MDGVDHNRHLGVGGVTVPGIEAGDVASKMINCTRGQRRGPPRGRAVLVVLAVAVATPLAYMARNAAIQPMLQPHASHGAGERRAVGGGLLAGQEEIAIFRLVGAEPQHLDALNPDRLVPNGSEAIHRAHQLGLPHAGVYMAVQDLNGRLLLLQRGAQVLSAWIVDRQGETQFACMHVCTLAHAYAWDVYRLRRVPDFTASWASMYIRTKMSEAPYIGPLTRNLVIRSL